MLLHVSEYNLYKMLLNVSEQIKKFIILVILMVVNIEDIISVIILCYNIFYIYSILYIEYYIKKEYICVLI